MNRIEIEIGTTEISPHRELLPAQHDVPKCFGCGLENPSGINLRFIKESPKTVSTCFTPPEDWTGWGRVMHGGFHSLLLDETMSWAPYALLGERAFMTTEMTLKYFHPVYVGQSIKIYGHISENHDREIIVRGEIKDRMDNLLTESHAVLMRVNPDMLKAMITADGERS